MLKAARDALVLALAALAMGGVNGVSAEDADDPTIVKVFAAWERRTKRNERLHCEWSEEQWFAAGWMDGVPLGPNEAPAKHRIPEPAAETRFASSHELTIASGRLMHRRKGKSWVARSRQFLERETIEYGSPNYLGFYASAIPGQAAANASKMPPQAADVYRSTQILPVTVALFPFDHQLGWFSDRKQWKLDRDPVFIDGRECLVLSRTLETYSREPSKSAQRHEMWVDPLREFAIARVLVYIGEVVMDQYEFKYSSNGSDGDGVAGAPGTPDEWVHYRFHRLGENAVYGSSRCRVTSIRLGRNVGEVPEFESLLPAGLTLKNVSGGTASRPAAIATASEPTARQEFGIAMVVAFAALTVIVVRRRMLKTA